MTAEPLECFSCGTPMSPTETQCPQCGWSYGADEDEEDDEAFQSSGPLEWFRNSRSMTLVTHAATIVIVLVALSFVVAALVIAGIVAGKAQIGLVIIVAIAGFAFWLAKKLLRRAAESETQKPSEESASAPSSADFN